jgi:glycosyltransferase involved in cell wall biosynthesis
MQRLNDIHEAMNSVLNQTLKPYEIVLAVDHNEELFERLQSSAVQNESTILPCDSSQQPQRTQSTPQTKVVHNTGVRGLSQTRNIGIRAASGEMVAFIDDDAVAEPDWLENLAKPFQSLAPDVQCRVVAVGGRAMPLWLSGSRPSWFPAELDWIVGCTYKGLPVETLNLEPETLNLELGTIRNVPGCNMAFRREVFAMVGGFRSEMGGLGETPRGGEETNLCMRIKHQMPQALIVYRRDALIHHKVPSRRLKLKYVVRRSYNEGFYKSVVERLSPKPPQETPRTQQMQALSTENSYLRYLLFTSIPARLRYCYKKGSLSQVGAIIISVIATGTGYLSGRVRRVDLSSEGE